MPANDIYKLYKGVIEEVIQSVRNDFVNMGVDEQVLYDLQMLWEQKLMDYKVISPNEYYSGNGLLLNNGDAGAAAAGGLSVLASSVAASGYPQQTQSVISHATGAPYPYHADIYGYPQAAGGMMPPGGKPGVATYFHPNQGYFEASVPPAANLPNVTYAQQQSQVPLQRLVRPPSFGAGHPPPPHQRPPQSAQRPPNGGANAGARPKGRYDGAGDDEAAIDEAQPDDERSPDEIIKLLFDSNSNGRGSSDKRTHDAPTEAATPTTAAPTMAVPIPENDDDLINSDLDDDEEDEANSGGEGDEDAATMDENVVLCQYEKVNRTRNKWRCVLKFGLIHVNGVDYAFSRANGEFEW